MIYVWDNGGSYSDHWIAFVESDLSPEQAEAAFRLADKEGHLIASAERLDWRQGKPTTILSLFESSNRDDPGCAIECDGDGRPVSVKPEWLKLPSELRMQLLALWSRWTPSDDPEMKMLTEAHVASTCESTQPTAEP